MAAQCAACLEPILKGDRFVLSGTEVFHGRCAIRRGTAASENQRLKQRVIAAETEARLSREQLSFQDRELAAERKRIAELKSLNADADRDYKRMRQERDSAWADVRYWRERALTMEVERDQARRELAIERQYPAQQPAAVPAPAVAAAPPVSTPDQAKDDLDDAAKRFSLLELDPLV